MPDPDSASPSHAYFVCLLGSFTLLYLSFACLMHVSISRHDEMQRVSSFLFFPFTLAMLVSLFCNSYHHSICGSWMTIVFVLGGGRTKETMTSSFVTTTREDLVYVSPKEKSFPVVVLAFSFELEKLAFWFKDNDIHGMEQRKEFVSMHSLPPLKWFL